MDQTQTFVQTIDFGTNLSVCTCLFVRRVIVVRLTWIKHEHSHKLTLTQERYMPLSRSSSDLYTDCLEYLQNIQNEYYVQCVHTYIRMYKNRIPMYIMYVLYGNTLCIIFNTYSTYNITLRT